MTIDFRTVNRSLNKENKVVVKNNFDSVMNFLLENSLSIYQKSTGKYWSRYYIELTKTSNKGSDYTIEEIAYYICEMFTQ